MGKQRTLSPAEELFRKNGPIRANPLQATPMYNSEYAQQYEGLPVSNETLALGVQNDLAFTTEGYGSQLAKNVGAALVNTLGFAASTVLSIPNLIDNQFNDGNDRIIRPLNEMQNNALENFQSYQNPGNEDQSVMEWLTPSFISGNTKSFWGDLIEQSGIIAGTTLGTGALLRAARFLPGIAAAETAVGTAVKGALSKVLKPATLLGEQLGMSKALANTVSSQKFINGLASATKTAGLNAVQSYTEALFQGLDGERNFVEDRIKEYETKFGSRPEGAELQEIENTARELKDTTFKFNMAGLMISNTPFTKAFFGGPPANFLTRLGKLGSTLDSTGKIVTKELDFLKGKSPYIAKPINFIAYKAPLAFNEGFEEIYQMGVEKGMDNYYTNKLNTEDFEANFSNVSKAISAGAKSILTKEGLKAFIAGAGVGGIFQGGNNFMQQRSLNQYLDKTTTVRDPITKQEKEITNREDILSNIKDIDSTVDGVFSLDPLTKNPTSLNQTFGERVQQFVTDNNNLQDSVKAEGSYIEYDQTQRTKFDSLYPYVRKGYKDVIVSKIEGAYQDLNKAELSDAQRQTLANQKQSALEDVNTVENFVNTIDNVFYEQFQDPSVQRIHTQLKDIAVYHLWNTENINRQSKELTAIYGDNLFEDQIAKGFTGTNITAILNKEIAKLQPQSPEIDLNADERAIFEKIKNSDNPTEAYFAYKQRNKPDGLLSSKDFLVLKKQKEYLQNRLKTNGDVLVNLSNVKSDPGKSFNFLLNYHGQAENIVKKTKTKVDTQETINKNENLITENVAPENQEAVKEQLGKKVEQPLTPTDIKEAEEVVKKASSGMVKKDIKAIIITIEKKRKAELEKEFSNVELVRSTVESGSSEVLQRQGIEWKKLWYGPLRVPVLEIIQAYKNINKKYDEELIEELEKEIANLRTEEQKEYSKVRPTDDMAQRGVIYDKYNKLITPLLEQLEKLKPTKTDIDTKKADIERRRQEELEKNVQDLKDKRNALRGKDGTVSKENIAEWQSLNKEINEAVNRASRADTAKTQSHISIKTKPKSVEENPSVLTGEDAKIAETIIEKIISKGIADGLSTTEIIQKINARYAFDANSQQALNNYISDRNSAAPEIGNNKQSFPAWRKGKYDAELKALETTEEEEALPSTKPKRTRKVDTKSKVDSKVFSDYVPKKNVQDAIKKLEEEKAIALSEGPLNEFLFETMMDKDEAIAMITQQYNELIQKEKDSQKTTTAERRLEGTTEGATITSEVLDDSESHLFYDIGLIRTQLHTGPKEIYTINLKDVEGNLVPAFTIQNNKDNFLIDLVLFNQFLDDYAKRPEIEPYINQLKQTESKMPFVKFLEVLLVLPESSGNEIFNFIQNTVFELKTDVETASDITEKGSVLKLFNFKGETLETLYQRLKAENNLYNIFQTNENTEEILSKLDIKIKDSNPIKLADYTILIKDSGAIGVVQVSNGEILSTLSISPEIRIKLAEQGVANNKEGYYAVFPTEGKYFLPGVRVSLGYEDLSEAGKMNFKVGFYYGDKNDFWNVRVLEDGKYELVNTSSKENKILENYDIFAKWIEDTKNKLKANITYFEKTQSTLQTIFEKGRVNHVVYQNNSVQITPLNEAYQEPIEENNMKPIEINELFEEPQENESTKFSWKIEKNGQYAVISDTMKVGEDTYILNPGITEDEVENFLGDSKKATVFLKVKDLVKNSGFYTKIENPNYSTVSSYQLDKIKEFIEKC